MLTNALSFITQELNDYFNRTFQPLEPKAVLSAHVTADGTPAADIVNKVSVTLINLEPEATVRNVPTAYRGADTRLQINPTINLNLHVLFAANFSEYTEALKFLEGTLAFFQSQTIFTPQNSPRLDKVFDRLAVELEAMSYQEWSHIWGILGTRYMPSVVYKIRMVPIQSGAVQSSIAPLSSVGINQ
jgi:hypothetical protein